MQFLEKFHAILKPAIRLASNWREREKMLAKQENERNEKCIDGIL